MKVIIEENEETKPYQLNHNLNNKKSNNIEIENSKITGKYDEKKAYIPSSNGIGPKIRGVSPKFYHELTIKKIDDDKRTGFYIKY